MPKSAPPRKTQSPAKRAARRPPTRPEATTTLVVDGVSYGLDPQDLTTLDIAALRKATGMGLVQLSLALASAPDIDIIAAFVWLSRRANGEAQLPYEMVAAEVGYDSSIDIVEAPEPADSEGSPEA